MHVKDAVDEYRYAILHHSPSTQEWYLSRLKAFSAWCETEHLQLEQVKAPEIRRYIARLHTIPSTRTGKQLSSHTVHGHARAIRAFLNWCSHEEGLEELVSEKTPRRIGMPHLESKIIETLTIDQIKALFAACEREYLPVLVERDRAILSVLLDTGVRASELCGLVLEDTVITPQEAYIKVLGKGSKWREVGMGNDARKTLHRYIARFRKAPKEERHVFLTRFLQPMSVNGLNQMLYRLAEWAHIEDARVSAHVWRHTFAVNYLTNGGDVYKLSRIMGHASVQVTERYLRALKARDARQGLSVLDTLKSQRKTKGQQHE